MPAWMPVWTSTLQNVLIGASILGLTSGVLGSFTLLRRESLLGDALAHATLPGVCVAFMLTGQKSPLVLLLGALVFGIIGSLFILGVVRWSRVKQDAAIGIILSVFFGLGIVLLTYVQRLPGGNQSGLDSFLFGQAATLLKEDVLLMAILGTIVLVSVALLFKEFKLAAFDPAFAASAGLPVRGLDVALTCLLVVVVVAGLQTVGVVLIIASLIMPPAAARQWTDRFGLMVCLSGAFGVVSGATGAVLSASVARLPTGPTIVLIAGVILGVSLLVAPGRGLVWAALQALRVRRRTREEHLLKDLYKAGEESGRFGEPVSLAHIMGVRGQRSREIERCADRLEDRGLLEPAGPEALRLTTDGLAEAARVVRKHRLWEVYLTRKLELPSDHVHRDAEAMEHAISEEALESLDDRLGHPERDPHGRPIPRGVPA